MAFLPNTDVFASYLNDGSLTQELGSIYQIGTSGDMINFFTTPNANGEQLRNGFAFLILSQNDTHYVQPVLHNTPAP